MEATMTTDQSERTHESQGETNQPNEANPIARVHDCPGAEAEGRLIAALDSAPVIRLGETLEQFAERYKQWYTGTRRDAMAKATGQAE